jgi:hypothetical protein
MTVLSRRATTIFDRSNYTILEITDLTDPVPTSYSPADLFGFYDLLLNVNETKQNWQYTTQFSLLFSLASYLHINQDNQLDSGGESRQLQLQAFLATPFAVFNDASFVLPDTVPDDPSIMGKQVGLAVPGYRVLSNSPRLMTATHFAGEFIPVHDRRDHVLTLVYHGIGCIDDSKASQNCDVR